MSKILAFSGSNSSTSINKSLIRYVGGLAGAEVVNLRDYNFSMFGEDLEKSDGIPADITTLQNKILAVDAVIISTPEHNGHLPAFFKNILNWLSRTGVKYLEGKLVLVLSTSNGGGGTAKAAAALDRPVRYAGGELFATLSLPNYRDNFDREAEVVINEEWNQIIKSTLNEMDIRLNARHGLLTYALLEILEGEVDMGGEEVTVNEIKTYVEERVPELSETYRGSPQYPTGYSFGRDFPIVILK